MRLLATWMVLLASLPLAAAPKQGEQLAEQLERANLLFAEGDWSRAAKLYEGIFQVRKDPTLRYKLAQAYTMMGDYGKAVQAYSRYVTEVPNAENVVEVTRLIEELTPLTRRGAGPPEKDHFPPLIQHAPFEVWPAGELIEIEAGIQDQSGVYEPKLFYRLATAGGYVAMILRPVDGSYQGMIAPMEVGDLQYFIEAYDINGNGPTRNGTPSLPHTVKIVPSATSRAAPAPVAAVSAAIAVAPAAPPPAPVKEAAVELPSQGGRGPWSYVALGSGIVAAGIGVVFGMSALSASGDWRASKDAAAWEDARTRANDAAGRATVSWVAAGALLAGGGALFFFTDF